MVCCDFSNSRRFDAMAIRLGTLFPRSETRGRAMAYIYNRQRPHTFKKGVPPALAEEKTQTTVR